MNQRNAALMRAFQPEVAQELILHAPDNACANDIAHQHIYDEKHMSNDVLQWFDNLGIHESITQRLRPIVKEYEEKQLWIGMSMRQLAMKNVRNALKQIP